jgi:hypothetical protein
MKLRERFQIGKNRYSVHLKSFIRNIHYTYDELYCMRLRERSQIGKRDTVYTKNDLIEIYTTPMTNFTVEIKRKIPNRKKEIQCILKMI